MCYKAGISSAKFYKWKAKHGELYIFDALKPKALEVKNIKLKKLFGLLNPR